VEEKSIVYRCEVCWRTFNSFEAAREHAIKYHKGIYGIDEIIEKVDWRYEI
jgi:hypothetical protein